MIDKYIQYIYNSSIGYGARYMAPMQSFTTIWKRKSFSFNYIQNVCLVVGDFRFSKLYAKTIYILAVDLKIEWIDNSCHYW